MTIVVNKDGVPLGRGLLRVSDREFSFMLSNASLPEPSVYRAFLNYTASIEMQPVMFFLAAAHGSRKHLEQVLNRGVDVTERDEDGLRLADSALFAATKRNLFYRSENAKFLLQHGADVNVDVGRGRTPLMFAANRNDPELVRVLCEHGADVERKDEEGCYALGYLNSDLPEIAKFLVTATTITGCPSATFRTNMKKHFKKLKCPNVLTVIRDFQPR